MLGCSSSYSKSLWFLNGPAFCKVVVFSPVRAGSVIDVDTFDLHRIDFAVKKLKSLSSNFKILNWFDEGCSKTTLLAGQQFGFIISFKIWLPRSFVRIESFFSKMAQLSVKSSSLVSAFGSGLWAHDRTSGEGHGDHWGRKKNLV